MKPAIPGCAAAKAAAAAAALVALSLALASDQVHRFAGRTAAWIHQGFLAVYIDAQAFISACF